MRPPLITPENNLWGNALGVAAAAFIIPVTLVLKLVTSPFERPVQRTADEVARYIRDFIEGTGGQWDWDDFECIPIADPTLEAIRNRVVRVLEPVGEDGLITLKRLLAEAEALGTGGAL